MYLNYIGQSRTGIRDASFLLGGWRLRGNRRGRDPCTTYYWISAACIAGRTFWDPFFYSFMINPDFPVGWFSFLISMSRSVPSGWMEKISNFLPKVSEWLEIKVCSLESVLSSSIQTQASVPRHHIMSSTAQHSTPRTTTTNSEGGLQIYMDRGGLFRYHTAWRGMAWHGIFMESSFSFYYLLCVIDDAD